MDSPRDARRGFRVKPRTPHSLRNSVHLASAPAAVVDGAAMKERFSRSSAGFAALVLAALAGSCRFSPVRYCTSDAMCGEGATCNLRTSSCEVPGTGGTFTLH